MPFLEFKFFPLFIDQYFVMTGAKALGKSKNKQQLNNLLSLLLSNSPYMLLMAQIAEKNGDHLTICIVQDNYMV